MIMTENQLTQLLDLAEDYCFLHCEFEYCCADNVTVLYYDAETETHFVVSLVDDFARIYFYDKEIHKNFGFHQIKDSNDKISNYQSHSLFLRKDAKVVLDTSVKSVYYLVKHVLIAFEDQLPF